MADTYQGNGTWGPQTGVAGFLNPFSRDLGATEFIPAAQQIFQNAGYNQQQTGASIGAGIKPRALGGTGLVAPAGTTSAYSSGPAQSGSVQGASTSNNSNNNSNNNSGSRAISEQDALRLGLDWNNLPSGFSRAGGNGSSYVDQLYSSLGSAYNNLSGQLDPMYQNRKQGIEDLYGAGVKDIGLQEQAGLDTLGNQRQGVQTNQVRNLKDLANAITQSYGSFSNQLGNMGAGDSSAAKVMMPYALSRVEASQRGGINRTTADKLGEIDQRESQLKNTVMQELNKLDQAKMGEMASLGEWFDNAKMQISQMRLSDAKAAGEQAMQFAMQKLQSIEDNFNSRKNALDSWAISNSKDLASLKQNLGAMTDPSLLGSLPQFNGLNINQSTGQSTGGYQAPTGFGYGSPEEIFKKLGLA